VISDAQHHGEGARPLRADAKLNRDRIVTAAAELFAARGLSAPLEDVAARAGVGVATLYRRFPARADLLAAVFERNITGYTRVVDKALAAPSAWDGFCALVVELCELQAGDAGLRDLLTTEFPASSDVEQRTGEALDKLRTLVARAQDQGSLRPDVTAGDVVVLLLANAGVLKTTGDAAPGAWRRFAALMLDAFGARPGTPLPEAPPEQQLRRSVALVTEPR
jgi:AcrR family transcriptional regulator